MAKENNMAKENDNNIEDDKEGAPETDTDEDGQVTPPRSPHLDDAMLTSPPKITTEKSKKARRMMATFKPRVQCGECDFVGKEGREMDTHRAKKHKKKECDECSFVAELSIVFRRHKIQKHHQKCKSCEFTTAASSALKVHEQAKHGGGVLRTSAGFMITSDSSSLVAHPSFLLFSRLDHPFLQKQNVKRLLPLFCALFQSHQRLLQLSSYKSIFL